MKEIIFDLGLAIVLAVIGIAVICMFVWFIGEISMAASVNADTGKEFLTCAACMGGGLWRL